MDLKSNFLKGMITGASGMIVKTIFNLLLIPITIHFMGAEVFGFYMFLVSTADLIVSIDMGLVTGLIHRLSSAYSYQDNTRISETLYLGQWLYILLALLMVGIGQVLIPSLPSLLHLDNVLRPLANTAFLVISLEGAVMLYGSYYRAVLMAHSMYHITNLTEILFIILVNVASVGLLMSGFGLLEILYIRLGLAIILSLGMMWQVLQVEPRAYRITGAFKFAAFRELCEVSTHSMILKVCGMVTSRLHVFIIGAWLGMVQVGIYTLLTRLFGQISFLAVKLTEGIFPILTRLMTEKKHERAGAFFKRVSCLTSFLTIFFILLFVWFFPEILQFMSKGMFNTQQTAPVLWTLIPFVWSSAMVIPATSFLFASNRFGFQTTATMMASVTNLGISLSLAQPLGLVGVALGTLPHVIEQQAIVIPSTCRDLFISRSQYLREVYLNNIPSWLIAIMTFHVSKLLFGNVLAGIVVMAISGALGLLLSLFSWIAFATTSAERQLLMKQVPFLLVLKERMIPSWQR